MFKGNEVRFDGLRSSIHHQERTASGQSIACDANV